MNGCSFQTTIGGRVNRFRLRNLKNYKRGLFQISYRPRFKKDTVARYDWNCAERKHNELAISVIVPTFNRVETLVHCLSALECQQLPPNESFEVIVVDDSSTDGTATLVKQWNKNFSRVRLLRLSHNGGPGRARNAGVIASLGKLLVFVDSDVIVKPGFLYAHWKRHGESLGCVSVGPVYYIDHIAEHKRHRFRWWTDASRAFFCTSNAAVEKHLFIKSGRFDADFQKYGWEDLELGERLRYVFDDGTKESMTSKEKRKMNIPRYFVKQAIAYHYKPPWTIGDLEKSIEQERQRGEMGVLFYKKHPTFRVRLMIQLTWFHRCLWLILSLFGIINEYSVKPLVIWLMDKRQYGIAHGLWSIWFERMTREPITAFVSIQALSWWRHGLKLLNKRLLSFRTKMIENDHSIGDWKQHRIVQRNIFNQQVENFLQPIPRDVQQRMAKIAEELLLQPQDKILDVGCGTGAMIPFIHQYIPLSQLSLCDCSDAMLKEAKKRFPECPAICSDFLELKRGNFDKLLFNAVFGNFVDQKAALEVAFSILKENGKILVSHPMGRYFVRELHFKDPQMVPHLLPTQQEWQSLLEGMDMSLEYYCDESQLYMARLSK